LLEAVIVSDPAVASLLKKEALFVPIAIVTEFAGVVQAESV